MVDIDNQLAEMFPKITPFLKLAKATIVLAVVGGIFALLIGLIVIIVQMWNTRTTKLSGLTWDTCKEEDLTTIHEIASANLSDIPDMDQTLAIYRHNRRCFRKILDTRKNNQIIGYAVLLPLTKSGIKKIDQKSFLAPKEDLNVFAKRNLPSGCSYYLGAAVAPNTLSRAKTVKVIKEFCETKKVSALYARPTTKLGLKSLKNNEFRPVHKEDKSEMGILFVRYHAPK